ncbi:MAG TPA: hypothetical protein VNN79_13860 [Actinomycetota bacterium]|nr:hypothetical protein [Actinomycetota bacterium]
MRRTIGIALAAVLAVGVIVAIIVSAAGGGGSKPTDAALVTVRGVIGSEKQPFFADRRVQAEFAKHGLRVQVDTAGSRAIATTVDLNQYDFAFPSGVPAAAAIKAKAKAATTYNVFYTPMVIASWRDITTILEQAGVAKNEGSYDTFDVAKFLELVKANTRWTDLKGSVAYPANKSVLITSTDVRTSNSAANYLSIASYVANGDNVVQSNSDGDKVVPDVAPLFLRQGFTAASSEEPFADYLTIGKGTAPIVFIYEAQFLQHVFADDGAITNDMRLLYPDPDVYSKHVVVPLDPNGDKVGRLLLTDPVLQQLAADYGFRTNNPAPFNKLVQQHHANIAPTIVDLIEPPSYEALEHMIEQIERLYAQVQGGATP